MKQIPNILTLANLFCGALAIIFILQSPSYIAAFNGQDYMVTAPQPVYYASVLIAIAAVIDFFDGFAARLLRVQSPIGKELDSLADVVTFGVAPGMILYQLLRSAYMQQPGAIDVNMASVAVALLLPCFGAYRLARFNTDDKPGENFVGVPIPAVGLLVASFPLIMLHNSFGLAPWLQKIWLLYLIIFLLCYLMVSTHPMISLKFKNLKFRDNLSRFVLIAAVAVSIPFLHYAVVPFAFVLYVALSLIMPPATQPHSDGVQPGGHSS